MSKNERVKAGQRAREFKAYGFVSDEGMNLLDPAFWADKSPAYNTIKRELYPLIAVFADPVIKKADAQRGEYPPFGLVKPIGGNFMGGIQLVTKEHLAGPVRFERLGNYMRFTLMRVAADQANEIKRGKSIPEISSVYKRLENILTFVRENIDKNVHPDPLHLLRKGINTATEVTSGLFELVTVLSDPDNPEQLIQNMKDSYALAARWTLGDREIIEKAITLLQNLPFQNISLVFPFYAKYFNIERGRDKKGLQLSQKGRERLLSAGIDPDDLGASRPLAVICPGAINLGDRPAVKIIWDWYLDIAKRLYLPSPVSE